MRFEGLASIPGSCTRRTVRRLFGMRNSPRTWSDRESGCMAEEGGNLWVDPLLRFEPGCSMSGMSKPAPP